MKVDIEVELVVVVGIFDSIGYMSQGIGVIVVVVVVIVGVDIDIIINNFVNHELGMVHSLVDIRHYCCCCCYKTIGEPSSIDSLHI